MMMTAAQVQAVKRNLLAAQVSYKRSELNEKSLYVELHNFFQHLKKTVLHELREYWKDDDSILLEGQLDLILAPIFESQQEYYNILRKHNVKEYNFGCREARRLVKLARKSVSSHKSENNTIKTNNLLKLAVDKDELFGTNDWTQQRLLDQSFTASEGTMNRVDKDINKIISDGYQSGAGINKVAANIETRFEQLKTWEAKRIARTEIHNAHQMGIMNTYYDMGVQYTQWSSAHDSRVRGLKPKDKADHVKMDGEIIPLGGTYSNGLQYPGDTKGPIYEWINCRCGNVPFIIPYGYIAPPGMAQFREEDLIQTLDYWNQDELIDIATQEAGVRQAELYKVPIKESLIENQFAVPTEDLSEFGISNNGLKTIQQIQKRNFGEHKEFGFRFDEKTGKILSDEFEGTGKYVDIPPSKRGNYSTIHNHTDDSLSAPSAGDFYTYFTRKRETVAVNVSRNDTWIIKVDRKRFNYKKVDKICSDVYDVETKQINKLKKEYELLKKEVKQGKRTKEELDKYLANDFIKKHNAELEKNLLEVLSDVKGLKVKRIINNTEINPKSIPKLKNIKTIQPNGKPKGIRKSPQIDDYTKQRLSQMTEREKLRALGKTLDKGQRIRYSELMKTLKSTTPSSKVYKEIKAQMFEYEKLLFKPRNPVPEIDMDAFILDNQNIRGARTIVGTILEKKQIELQEKIILNWKELHAVKTYGGSFHTQINGFIRKNDDWIKYLEKQLSHGHTEEDIIKKIEDLIEDLDSAMEKTTGLAQDSTIFRACDTFSGTLRPGDISSFEGYGSCSFQEESAKGFMDEGRYKLKILAPKGQKGIAMNARNDGVKITSHTHEHEFLLPKNQKFQVIEVDHYKHEATILLI